MATGVHVRDRLLLPAVGHHCGNEAGAFLDTHPELPNTDA